MGSLKISNYALRWALFGQTALWLVFCVFLSTNIKHGDWGRAATILASWDGPHYLDLAKDGYSAVGDASNWIVFYPLYPWLCRTLIWLGASPLWAALLISNGCSIIGHAVFIQLLIEHGYAPEKLKRCVFLFFLTPMAVYFCLTYTEGTFLLTSCLCFLALSRKRFGTAAVFAGLGTLTRAVGMSLIVPYLVRVFETRRESTPKQTLIKLFFSLSVPLAYGIYLAINWQLFHDPFYFKKVMAKHWYKSPANPIPIFWHHAVHFFTSRPDFSNLSVIWDEGALVLVPVLFLAYFIRPKTSSRMPTGWILYFAAQWLIIITAQGHWWMSSARYVGIIFPVFLMLEDVASRVPYLFGLLAAGSFALALRVMWLVARGAWAF